METIKLFYEDAYLKTFEAIVKMAEDDKLILDSTCFYPESGGQPFDTGSIEGISVINTQINKETQEIIHTIERKDIIKVEQKVSCKIDWDKRYNYMKLHSALHILYLAFTEKYGNCKLRGATIESEKARLDVEFFEEIDVADLSQKVNDIISANSTISTYPDENKKNFRYWKIENYPVIPCGGTHVQNTSEIGNVNCKIKNKGNQGQRIYISFN
jgi:alanyl-tRNA synthetase